MSPRAEWRLESLGFTRSYDYVAGKVDWFAAGLPRAGKRASVLRVVEVAHRDAATCGLTDRLGDVASRTRDAGQDACLVLNDQDVVLGRVRARAFDGDPDLPVEGAMEAGPTTIRPDKTVEEMAERLRSRSIPSIVVTTSEGRLVGTFHVDEAERRLADEAESCLCYE